MSQTKTQMVKNSFGGHLSPIVHAGSSSSSSSTPSHGDEDAISMLNYGHFGLHQNLNLYQNWQTQNSNNENSSSTSSSSSNWSTMPVEPSLNIEELLKSSTSGAQSSLSEQQRLDMTDSNWSPFSSMQQQTQPQQQQQHLSASEGGANWSGGAEFAKWSGEAEFAEWASKKSQQVPPQAQSKSWAKIVSQQSSPSTNGQNQTTNQKNEISHEWDIKVNQTVPWNLEAAVQSQTQTVVPSSSTSSAASSSSSSTSSISSNEKMINNLIQLNKEKGTEIWLGNPTKSMWEQKESAAVAAATPMPVDVHNWSPNQQAPQWNVGWNEPWSADQALVQQQQHQQLMAKIEPTGWDDPDFKQSKKSDDGTAIWGDPEQSKMVKIQKWSYSNKHVPNPATIKPDGEHPYQLKSMTQSQSTTSSWNNTPAAPLPIDSANHSADWNSDLVDTKTWHKENKGEHEWDQGRVDTSNWGINISNTKNNFDPSIGVVDTSKWSSSTQGLNPANQAVTSKPNSQANTPGLLNMSNTGPISQDWNPNMLRDEEARKLNRINSHPSSGNLQNRTANKIPANFANQTPVQSSNLLGNNLSQSQLLESYKIAVQTNLISPDLLNNKLPSDVLALLNQLFQTLNLYTNSINRINSLTKRCAHLNPQYKSELDQLKQENQTQKENLLVYQKRINAAHVLLKQQQQQQQFAGASNLIGNLTAGEINSICDMPSMISKDNQNQKMMQMFHEQKMAQYAATQNPINGQNQLNKMSNSLFNHNSTPLGAAGQWNGFNSLMGERQPQIDDRITPFVPGKPWAGHGQPSIEDDPNCTPGSFSKPLLTETIDPESILSNLTRGNNWSNNLDFLGTNPNSLLGLNNNNNNNRFGQRNTWGQNNFNSLNNSLDSNTGTIGEQLWGVRNNSSRNGMNANSPSNINRNLPGQFNSLINPQQQQQQQQQFYRSNSWNIGASGNNAFSNPSQLNINNGYYLLIRNVTPQIDQTILKGLCSQYANGQLTYFKYIPNKSCVIVRYNTKDETNKAHAKLNSISLGNTTINTQMISENDIKFELL